MQNRVNPTNLILMPDGECIILYKFIIIFFFLQIFSIFFFSTLHVQSEILCTGSQQTLYQIHSPWKPSLLCILSIIHSLQTCFAIFNIVLIKMFTNHKCIENSTDQKQKQNQDKNVAFTNMYVFIISLDIARCLLCIV